MKRLPHLRARHVLTERPDGFLFRNLTRENSWRGDEVFDPVLLTHMDAPREFTEHIGGASELGVEQDVGVAHELGSGLLADLDALRNRRNRLHVVPMAVVLGEIAEAF